MKEFVINWSVENFSYAWHETGEPMTSPSFIAGPMRNTTWNLLLYPRGYTDPDCLTLFLRRGTDNGPTYLSINFELSCISAENLQLHSHTFVEDDNFFTSNCLGFGPLCFMRRHELFFQRKALYLPRDVLTLRCRMWKDEGTADEFGQSFGRTRLPIERILIVVNFNSQSIGENIFDIHSKRQNKSLMTINMMNCRDSIRVVINPTSVENIKSFVLKLSFMGKMLRKILWEHTITSLGKPLREIKRFPLVYKAIDTGNKDPVENTVELQIEFVYSTGEEKKQIENDDSYSSKFSEHVSKYIMSCSPSGNLSDLPRIIQDLSNLHVEHVLCDVELKTQTTSFFAHKFVLCARSPVLLAMLTGDMKEMRNKCIEIEDIVDDILEKFLLFLYTDTFGDLELDVVIGLYYAADKYQVERLKMLCCSYLLNNIDVDNVCELLMLADRHHDSDFKRRVEDFILQNDERVFSSSTWERFVDEQPFLPAKTMILRYTKKIGKEDDALTYDEKLISLSNVQEDFTTAYQDGIITDIVIKTTDATFHAHRCVLGASSSIMREKFAKDMKDKPNDVLEILDLEDGIVSRVLLFLYTDSLGDVQWDTAIKLYNAADVYQIQRLKIKCSCFLLENLEISNAIDLLLMAHEHSDARLKSVIEDYIFLHDEEIFRSDQWADFSETNFRLANETMRSKYRKS